jgi:hypothetical protein
MSHWTATEWTLMLGAVSTALGSLILVVQRSTCTNIKCGCIECEREVRSLEQLEAPTEQLDAITQDDVQHRLSSTLSNAPAIRSSSPARPSVAHLVGNLERRA